MDLIKRQDAIDAVSEDIEDCFVLHDAIKSIQGVPSAEIIRCKDCKYYLNFNEKCGLIDTRLHFYETDKTWVEDCFCSWAERRTE